MRPAPATTQSKPKPKMAIDVGSGTSWILTPSNPAKLLPVLPPLEGAEVPLKKVISVVALEATKFAVNFCQVTPVVVVGMRLWV